MTHVHFVGIGGAGLSAIARIMLESGHTVSGSDRALSNFAAALAGLGATIYIGHAPEHVQGADRLVISSAIPADNVEVRAARAQGIPVLRRAEFLSDFMRDKVGVAVAGSHGKTTTTGLVAFVLDRAGLDPTYLVGGELEDTGRNAHAGKGAAFVVEADEYDRMFLGLHPKIAVVTNIEHDHPDLFPTFAALQQAFREFAARVTEDGTLIVCADDSGARSLGDERRAEGARVLTYGLAGSPDWKAEDVQPNGAGGSDFLATQRGKTLGLARTRLPGRHNVANSLAALAVVDLLGVEFNTARGALAEYRGAGRRFEVIGEAAGVTVIDDYAHHPTEIRATLAAARLRFGSRPIWAMFQPHTYSRTKALLQDFAGAFHDADHVIVTEIFASRERPDPAVSSAELVRRMDHPDAHYIPELEEVAQSLSGSLQAGDVLITLGAGNANWVGEEVLRRLQNGASEAATS